MYDLDFSLRAAQKYTVAVTYLIDLIHFSYGSYGKDWVKDTFLFHDYYTKNLPQAINNINIEQYKKKEHRIEKKLLKKLKRSKIPNLYRKEWLKRIHIKNKLYLWIDAIRFLLRS